ncbi:MAG: hypothetical protein HOK80_09130 [Candidatus Cloacimonetes bacterium]|jgi:hypothetical protein|nr:hypothetical protein [Candidatus Cloacimonadota bacterium]
MPPNDFPNDDDIQGFMDNQKLIEDRMNIWNKVCNSDPEQLQYVKQRGGFLSICAQTQVKKATELFGAYGATWGLKHTDFSYNHFNMYDYYDKEITTKPVYQLRATFFYPGGEMPANTSILMDTSGDWEKKLETDIITKCLSRLGFNSDVFEGLFDDNKYVSEITAPVKYREECKKLAIEVLGKEKGKEIISRLEKLGWPFDKTVATAKKLALKVTKEVKNDEV